MTTSKKSKTQKKDKWTMQNLPRGKDATKVARDFAKELLLSLIHI